MDAPFASVGKPVIIRVEDLWYEDGNVVLVAGDCAFRVHRSILSQYSPVFRDLFTVPQPADTKTPDASAVVHLPDDRVELGHILRAIYDVSFLDSIQSTRLPEPVILAIAKLAHKYQMDALFAKAVAALKRIYPATLPEYDALSPHLKEWDPPFARVHVITMLNLAQRIRPSALDTMVPFARYVGAQLGISVLLDGLRQYDGTMEFLNSDDLKQCIGGREDLVHHDIYTTIHVITDPESPFTDCEKACADRVGEIVRRWSISMGPDILDSAKHSMEAVDTLQYTGDICQKCSSHLKQEYKDQRESNWASVLSLFRQ